MKICEFQWLLKNLEKSSIQYPTIGQIFQSFDHRSAFGNVFQNAIQGLLKLPGGGEHKD